MTFRNCSQPLSRWAFGFDVFYGGWYKKVNGILTCPESRPEFHGDIEVAVIACVECKYSREVADDLLGKKMKCRKCGGSSVVEPFSEERISDGEIDSVKSAKKCHWCGVRASRTCHSCFKHGCTLCVKPKRYPSGEGSSKKLDTCRECSRSHSVIGFTVAGVLVVIYLVLDQLGIIDWVLLL